VLRLWRREGLKVPQKALLGDERPGGGAAAAQHLARVDDAAGAPLGDAVAAAFERLDGDLAILPPHLDGEPMDHRILFRPLAFARQPH
jgi:hypothetical protein